VLKELPRVRERSPLVCQIFNWSEKPEVTGVRLADVLESAGIDAPPGGYFAFYSADGMYFESLPRTLAFDRRTLLVLGINGVPLPHALGGPVRLWVPFLQGYKSVKWLEKARAFTRDPRGIKRLLGQSKTAVLGAPGQEKAGIVMAKVMTGEPVANI
jgi:DMSO/TMAO reductase YedYZ molybdopterin-dependent catalytic subunit